MKKMIFVLVLPLALIISCKKDQNEPNSPGTGNQGLQVEKKNRAAIIYFGEDWCVPCGSFGAPTLDTLLNLESDSLTGFQICFTSNNTTLNWTEGSNMFGEFDSGVFGNINGIPSLAVNTEKQLIYPQIATTALQSMQKVSAFSVTQVIAGIALDKIIQNDTLFVNSRVKFYNAIPAGSNYSLALFIVEDSIVANQNTNAGYVANYVHRNIVRTSNGNDYTGTALNNLTAIAAEQNFDKIYKFPIDPLWNKNKLKVVGIVWKKGTVPAKVVNSNVD